MIAQDKKNRTEKQVFKKLRVAGIGDLHVGVSDRGRSYADLFREISDVADVLALCGDLTNTGTAEEAERIARDLSALSIPSVGVLGNHDHESDEVAEVDAILRGAGVLPLGSHVQEIGGVGFAGVKGFCGGFGRHMLGSFGEEITKEFAGEAVAECIQLENALQHLEGYDRVVAVLHYSPIVGTLGDEPREVYPFLGSSRLEETIDRFDCIKAVLHGHIHRGSPFGKTATGIPVYNCAFGVPQPGGRPYALVEV